MSTAQPPIPPRLVELRFLYQPVVCLHGRDDGWSEALVRWQLPDGTVRGPLDVLPHWLAAPRQAAFTQHTLTQASIALVAVPEAQVAVNLSPTQALHPVTLSLLDGLLPEVRSRLRIEITEQRVRDMPALGPALEAIRARCASVLLDDVTPDDFDLRSRALQGLDGVKLDRSVVQRLFTEAADGSTRRFVEVVCERFPIVVAEGIEEIARCDALRELGVTHAQGFGIARPRSELAGRRLDRRVPFQPPAPPAQRTAPLTVRERVESRSDHDDPKAS